MKSLVLLIISIAAVAAVWFLVPPFAQDPAYHQFADSRELYGIANFWDAASNGLILLVGVIGIVRSATLGESHYYLGLRREFGVFFVGAVLTAVTSAIYHQAPTNELLAWDRIAMAILFASILSIVISIFISELAGKLLFLPLLLAAVASVIFWYKTEQLGAGDLRFYALTQFLSAFLILLIIIMFRGMQRPAGILIIALLFYAASKVSEHYDALVFDYTGIISGHSLKHIFSGLALFMVYLILRRKHA